LDWDRRKAEGLGFDTSANLPLLVFHRVRDALGGAGESRRDGEDLSEEIGREDSYGHEHAEERARCDEQAVQYHDDSEDREADFQGWSSGFVRHVRVGGRSEEYLRFETTGKYLLRRPHSPDVPPSRRRALGFGALAVSGWLAGCASGILREAPESGESPETDATTGKPTGRNETTGEMAIGETTTEELPPVTVETPHPEESNEFPDGPKSRPERPVELTAETVREFVRTFEYRWVYNTLYGDETTSVHAECGVESVTEYDLGFRVVAWCSAWADSEQNGTTIHADYFTQYATYLVSDDGVTRYEGRSKTRN
jgi:hypothetical protein